MADRRRGPAGRRPGAATRRRRLRRTVVVTGLLAAGGVTLVQLLTAGPAPLAPQTCRVEAASGPVVLDAEQARTAATVAAVAVGRQLSERAVIVALATALQESKLRNLRGGDRDSLGVFQQRPTQGWGSPEQVLDPVHAANRFYDALVRLPYRTLAVTVAAQRVQHSGFPRAYAAHEQTARVLAGALTGRRAAGLSCAVRPGSYAAETAGSSGLTPRATRLRGQLEREFGRQQLGGFAPGGVSAGHGGDSAHYDGRALDVFFRPVDRRHRRRGWAVAQWSVAQAGRLGIATVIYDDRIWTAARSREGWRRYAAPDGPGDPAVLRHVDHVHLDVQAGA